MQLMCSHTSSGECTVYLSCKVNTCTHKNLWMKKKKHLHLMHAIRPQKLNVLLAF